MQVQQEISEEHNLENLLKNFKKSIWINSIILIFMGVILALWLYDNGKIIESSEGIIMLKISLTQINRATSVAMFCNIFLLILYNTYQAIILYKIIALITSSIVIRSKPNEFH